MKTIPKSIKDQLQRYLSTAKTRNVCDKAEKLDFSQANMNSETISEEFRHIIHSDLFFCVQSFSIYLKTHFLDSKMTV